MMHSDHTAHPSCAAESAAPHPTGWVLVVDDDDGVREVVELILRADGWEPLLAPSAVVGEQLFRRHRDRIGLVLTDIAMPERNGYWLAGRIRAICLRVPIIGVSGYRDVAEYAADHFQQFLPKPFFPVDLLTAVRDSYLAPTANDGWAEPAA